MSEKTLAAIGIKRAGESKFSNQTHDQPIRPGTYSAASFAKLYPDEYLRFTRAGMPHAVQSLITIIGE